MTHEHTPQFLADGGEMGERIRNFDWSTTSLGPVERWPKSLRTCVQIMLTSRQPIWIGWGKDLIKLYNDPYKAIVKGKHPWALGKPASIVWAELWDDIEPMLEKVMVQNEGTYVEKQLLIMERNGYPEETYYTFSYTPVAGDEGTTAGMICFNTDDTERVITERQLATLTELSKILSDCKSNREVFEGSVTAMRNNPFDFPFAKIYQLSNDRATLAAATFDIAKYEHVPKQILFSENNDFTQGIARALETRQNQIVKGISHKLPGMPTGAWEAAADNAIVLPIIQRGQNAIYGVMVVGANPNQLVSDKYLDFFNLVTDQVATSIVNVHALEEERKRITALAEIDKAKTTFFSNISHEFRTPLTLLLGPIEDLLNDDNLQRANKTKVEVAYRNAHRMQKLVNLLLDFSRIEAGRMEASFSKVDLASFTKDLASNFRSAVEKAGMELIVEEEQIHDPVYVDVDMWEKIVLNLLSNAFKYSERGFIKVALGQRDKYAQLTVEDTGIGIPESELENIFQRFHRVQSAGGRSQEGTGIGLAMVKELVRQHHGSITVESKVGQGSKFIVRIPTGKAHLNGNVRLSEPSLQNKNTITYLQEVSQWIDDGTTDIKTASQEVAEKQHTILLADDNADMRGYVQRLLEPHYNVIVAKDGEEAFKLSLSSKPDLILSDIMMPKLDGFALLEKLKSTLSTRNIPVIFLSARAGEEAKIEGLNAGANDYLVKPFSSRELIARVTSQITATEARRKTEKEFFNLFMQSPAHIHVFRGPEHVLEFFHPLGRQFMGGRDLTGMKVREALPELEGQGYFEMLDNVYQKRETIRISNSKATFKQEDGSTKDFYFNITYLPWLDLDNNVQGVLQFTFEVTETVEQRVRAEANEKKFRSIAQQAPVAMSVLRGPRYIVEVANNKLLEMWGKSYDEVIGKSVLDIFPELISQGFEDLLKHVYTTGEPFIASEIPSTFSKHGREVTLKLNLLYEAFRNENNEIEGIVAVGTDVTEQVEARNKVAEAELRFRTIIEQTPSPLCIFKGEEMRLEVANDAALAVWNATREVIGKTLVEIVPEMGKQIFLNLMQEVYHTGETRYGFEAPAYFIVDGKREEYFFNFTYVPFRDTNGTITGVLVLASNVTEQVRAKKQLMDNEERLTIATEVLGLGTWEYDPIRDVLFASEKTNEIFGFHPASHPTMQEILERIVPEDRDRVVEALTKAFAPSSKGKYDAEYSLRNPVDGILRTVRGNGQAFFDEAGKPYRFIGTVIDITEQKKAEQEIRTREERFRLLATTIPQIVWTADASGKTDYISNQWEAFTAQKVEDALDNFGNLLHPDDSRIVNAKWERALAHGEPWESEYRLRNVKTDQYRWFYGKCVPLIDGNNKVIKWIGSASDIQEFKEQSSWLESQVQERTKALKELNQSLKISNEDLQQFAHVASHDLKEPIRKIKTFGNRLLDEYNSYLPEKANTFLNKILSATDRMYAMVEGVLSYSTLSATDQPAEPVDLNEVIENIKTDLEVLIQDKGATIEAENLPTIKGAPVLLYQLFYNLINNSIKFSRDGVPAMINVKATSAELEGLRFSKIVVQDNGIGFEQDQAERIFTTFTRLNSKDKYEGTGLGLALCKKIVQRHGGFIAASGERGKGAEFTILLPNNT